MVKNKHEINYSKLKLKKYPSNFHLNPNHTFLLYALGKSETPLSTRALEKNIPGLSSYIYDMIDKMTPDEYSADKYLFTLQELLDNKNNGAYKYNLIKRFNRLFGLGWKIGDKRDYQHIANNHIHFAENDSSKQLITINIIFLHNSKNVNNAVSIILDKTKMAMTEKNSGYAATMMIIKNNKVVEAKYSLLAKTTKEDKLEVYMEKHNPLQTRNYLEITSKPKVKKMISDKRKELFEKISDKRRNAGDYSEPNFTDALVYDTYHELKKAKIDRRNWRYSLSFHGFLLYLFCEAKFFAWKNKKESRKRIREVISNPAIRKKAQFLKYWEDFEEAGFDVIGILTDIGTEFQSQLEEGYQLEGDNLPYLLGRVTDRYFVPVTNYFHTLLESPSCYLYLKKVGDQKFNEMQKIVNEYRLSILKLKKQWLTEQSEVTDRLHGIYSKQNII